MLLLVSQSIVMNVKKQRVWFVSLAFALLLLLLVAVCLIADEKWLLRLDHIL